MASRSDYWTTQVFVKQAPLYSEVLGALKPAAGREVQGIRRILDKEGISHRARVLDIACGIGRHIIPLAEDGYQAVGCDFSPGFIDQARKGAQETGLSERRLRFYLSDYRRIDRTLKRAREGPFDVAICIFTSMGHYGESGDLTVLRAVRRVVRPGGLFVMEMGDRDWVLRNYEPASVSQASPRLELRERRSFDWERSVVHSNWKFYRREGRRRRKVFEQDITIRLYSLHELRRLFEQAGWEYVCSYGSLTTLEPVSLRSRRLVVVGRRPFGRGRAGRALAMGPSRGRFPRVSRVHPSRSMPHRHCLPSRSRAWPAPSRFV